MPAFPEYDQHDATGLAGLVAAREVTPLDLLDAAIERVEALNPSLNAVVHQDVERARAHAADPPAGPFRGVPFLLKDLMGYDAGQPSTSSMKLLGDRRAPHDSSLVARYKRAGLVVLGRTNTPELGIYGVTESVYRGPARNPWNPDHTPGGSSGGSGAAVAARIVPMAHGGDGGGSIRIPASHCGLVGLKPTRGRNPSGPYAADSWGGLAVEHVLTRSVRDTAAALDATHGPDVGVPYDVRAPAGPFLAEVGRPPGRLRVAFTTAALFGDALHDDNAAAVRDAAALAESLGHDVVEDVPDFDKAVLVRAYLIMVAAGVNLEIHEAATLLGRSARASDVEPASWLLSLIADKLSAAEYVRARAAILAASRALGAFFERYDVLLTATTAVPPPLIGANALSRSERLLLGVLRRFPAKGLLMKALDELSHTALAATPNTMLFNLTGQPAISLPLYWNDIGLPIGTQWVGRWADEATLLRLAAQVEEARPWATRRPPAPGTS